MEFDLYFVELIIVEVSSVCKGFPSTCSYAHFQFVCPRILEHKHRIKYLEKGKFCKLVFMQNAQSTMK